MIEPFQNQRPSPALTYANLKNTSSLFLFKLLFFFRSLKKSSFLSTSLSISVSAFPSTAVLLFFWGVRTPSLSLPSLSQCLRSLSPLYDFVLGGSTDPLSLSAFATVEKGSPYPPKKTKKIVEGNANTEIDRDVERNEKLE